MDSPAPKGAISDLVSILRRVTRIVQLLPFAYLLLLAVCLIADGFMTDFGYRIVDNLFNAPVYAVVCMLGTGRLLRLCKWFKAACLMPMATKIESFIDSFVITFTQSEVVIINTCLGILFLIYIYASFRHFFHEKQSRC